MKNLEKVRAEEKLALERMKVWTCLSNGLLRYEFVCPYKAGFPLRPYRNKRSIFLCVSVISSTVSLRKNEETRYVTIRYVILRYVMLRCVMLHYVMLRCVALYYVVLCYTTLCCVTLPYVTLQYSTLRYGASEVKNKL